MEIIKMRLSALKLDDLYQLSYPIKPEVCHQAMKKISPFPTIIINSENTVIHGIDIYYYLKSRNQTTVEVMKLDIPPEKALILNFNLKEKMVGVNLYEKLVFIKKIYTFMNPEKLHQITAFRIPINRELLSKLDLLCSDEFKNVLINEKISLKTALKICSFKKKEQPELLNLFENINFSFSQQLNLIEMLEEIIFRDKSTLGEILKKASITSFLDQEKPQKIILSQIFKLRYPRYTREVIEWEKKIKKLKLPQYIKVFHSPFFEKKEIQLSATFRTFEEAKKLFRKLKK